ncbi:MAG: hypothetical protein AAF423_13070 [Pseudomonadota bacterium]
MSVFIKNATAVAYIFAATTAATFSFSAPANAGFGSCSGNVCKSALIEGVKCAAFAVTNAADKWTMSLSYNDDGSDPFFEGVGQGEDDTPVKWVSGKAVFKAESDSVYVSFTANGSSDVTMHTGGGAADGSVGTIINGEDGADTDFNDIIVGVSCTQQ